MKKILSAFFVASLCISPAHPEPILIDFENIPVTPSGIEEVKNLNMEGFRLSVNRSYSIIGPSDDVVSNYPSNWFSWTIHGGPNPDYLGPPFPTSFDPPSNLYIDRNGEQFSFLGFDPVGAWNPLTIHFRSSNGGDLTVSGGTHVDFSGSGWSDINWILATQETHTGGLDNLRFAITDRINSVPEPGTAILVGLAGLMLIGFTHRKRTYQ